MLGRKRQGVFLAEIVMIIVTIFIAAYGFAIIYSGQFILADSKRVALQAQQLAQVKATEASYTDYDSVSSLAESLTAISGTEFSREVIVGSESTNSSGYKERLITVNVYKTEESIARFSATTTVTSAGTSSSSSSSTHGKTLFTASGTFTVPSSTTKVWVSMCGGGGGGGVGTYGGGGGGGGAAVLAQATTVTAGETITITVGSGGSAASTGGTSKFGSYISCAGGGAGASLNGKAGSAGGTGGSAGSPGYMMKEPSNYYLWFNGGKGGGNIFGVGGAGGSLLSTGTSGGGYGGGGGGGSAYWYYNGDQNYKTYNGGSGSSGFVLVEW